MATTYKVLGQLVPAAAVLSTLYTVPGATQAVCSTISACNQGTSATTIRIAIRPAGASIDPKHYIVYDVYLNAYDTLFFTIGATLGAADVVSVYSLSGSVSFNLFGSELT